MSNETKTGLTKKHWFGYMCGDWGGCMTFTLMASIFSVFCTNALGVDPKLLGTLVIIWTIWDAVNDPLMGALMDRAFVKRQDPRGKFRPWLLRATPLLAVTAIALWTVPTFFDGIALIVVLFSVKILYEAAYTMFNIPMGSLLSAMSTNDAERASLSSARGAGSGFGNALPGIFAPMIIAAFGDRGTTGYMIHRRHGNCRRGDQVYRYSHGSEQEPALRGPVPPRHLQLHHAVRLHHPGHVYVFRRVP